MRRIENLKDVQIVLNELHNRLDPLENKVLDRHGLKISNLGPGVDPNDAATVSQLPNPRIPTEAKTEYHYTIVWSKEETPTVDDIIPPFCIVERGRVAGPVSVWLAAAVLGESLLDGDGNEIGTLKINIIIDGRKPVAERKYLLNKDLELKIDSKGPVKSSDFHFPVPFFGYDSFIQPIIKQVNKQASISIGLVMKNERHSKLV